MARTRAGVRHSASEGGQGGRVLHPPVPPRDDVGSLGLSELRAYRRLLQAEEDRVSYWRRVVQARLDVLEMEGPSRDGSIGLDQLARALGDTGTGRVRRALGRLSTADPLPELPALERFWDEAPDPADATATRDVTARLRADEQQLTAYRHALHRRLDAATAHLVERYRRDPRAALALLSSE